MKEEPKLKPVVSTKKLEANRRNALRSTGPRTARGKNALRWNALKHGLLAQEIVIPEGPGRESAAAFRHLLAQLRQQLAPSGVLEEILVEKIAACYWRLRRVVRAEAGEIQLGISDASEERARNLRIMGRLLAGGFSRQSPVAPSNTSLDSPSGESGISLESAFEDKPEDRKENARLALERVSRTLPGTATVEKILRYETAIERQLYRALHQLERMQRRRGGEAVPPPVSVEFSGVA